MDYPEEWNQLSKHERKKKLKVLKHEHESNIATIKKISNWGLVIVLLFLGVFGYIQLTKKTPEQIVFLEGRVEKFTVEGRDHVTANTNVEYQTNPPTSGGHLDQAGKWGVYAIEIDDKVGVHNLEHGGIWISYKDVEKETIKTLEEIGKANPQSVIVSPRSSNDDKIVVASWGKLMRLELADKALIQKYIDMYKNKSPEKLAR